jgi:hypothetical protein
MRRGLGPGAAALFVVFLLLRRLLIRDSAHFSHGALRVLIVVVALLAVAGLRVLVSRR